MNTYIRKVPKSGEKFKHFKGNEYKILCVAKHSETNEQVVVYRSCVDIDSYYVRPLDMFMSEVDKEKYPNVSQKYRFERVIDKVKVKKL